VISLVDLRYRWPGAQRDTLNLPVLELPAGQTLFLQGDSGCGKSTLLGVLAGVLLPTAGQAVVLGQDWAAVPARQRDAFRAQHLGVVFQQFNLLPYLSALQNVLLPCQLSPRRAERTAPQGGPLATAAALLQGMGLDAEHHLRAASALSVGQQQRVAAARALIGAPELLLADEPTSALDSSVRDQFMALLLAQVRAAGSTLVFVSHDERLADGFDQCLALPTLNRAGAA
jgi:putative ABC transport system ATP-binding protein